MFNNNNLPLNKAQKFQVRCAKWDTKKRVSHNQAEELELFNKYRTGDEDAGWELFTRYIDLASYIYKFPHKAQYKNNTDINIEWSSVEKEDLFQEIAYSFFKLLERYDEQKGAIVALMKSSLHLDVYRSFFEEIVDQKFKEVEFDDNVGDVELVQTESTPAQYAELYRALDKLTKRQRYIIEKSCSNDWNSAEIAEELGISPSSVRSHLQKAKERLRELLEGIYTENNSSNNTQLAS
ncbi:sigma-70 family RNA polymerase sigma factor [Bacillus sporothermodurans]|uniref:RNA polymerase sigma factor n=1 Tax=Heyndrickxia sporothermodurans TaxID=46224 RepID=UPI00192C1E50|nr:sigma-70 family RNA polymerase sigma factor [Heyndrickxia sporothermodurans]MBL5872332.1 sigma-70 family RNA polymerase sigma factor [Heyndrickxia sporothermodurans]